MSQIGHNGGPELDAPIAWRTYAWGRARTALMPTLPIEVVRLRVKRAAELGLDYKTYAGVRAATGRDVIGFLFSSNALRVVRAGEALPADRIVRLEGITGADRVLCCSRRCRPWWRRGTGPWTGRSWRRHRC